MLRVERCVFLLIIHIMECIVIRRTTLFQRICAVYSYISDELLRQAQAPQCDAREGDELVALAVVM